MPRTTRVALSASVIRKRLNDARHEASVHAIENTARTQFVVLKDTNPTRSNVNIQTRLSGLTKRLHDRFYPRHSFGGKYKARRLGIRGGSSAKDGTDVHARVRHAINCRRVCSCPRKVPH